MTTPASDAPPRVAAIVPVYNEADTLVEVLTVLKGIPRLDEILVVSDGSTDDTVEVARRMGVKTVDLRRNYGKALAMSMGVAHTRAEVVLFVDGDILNLSEYLLSQLIEPVLEDRVQMMVGIRHRGWLLDVIHRKLGPLLSGIRCLRREIFEAVPDEYLKGFTVETALNWTCCQLGMGIGTVVMHDLRHVVKERKRGLRNGMRSRYRMFEAVFRAWVALNWKRPGLRGAAHPPRRAPEAEFINW